MIEILNQIIPYEAIRFQLGLLVGILGAAVIRRIEKNNLKRKGKLKE